MRKFTLLGLAFVSFVSFSQVSVTYQVDITDYLSGGNTLDPNGIRVGGDFGTQSGTTGGNAMADWTPSDANSAMTDMGNNVWSITVEYPASSVGQTQLYKFVNGDWGMNEGTDASSTIASDSCGVDDGAGNINRTLVIPSSDITLLYCWDACTQCDGSSPASIEESLINAVEVFPNPATDILNVSFDSNLSGSNVNIEIFDITGQKVHTATASNTLTNVDVSTLEAGSYLVQLSVDGSSVVKKFTKQ